jgi:hypothetical protein
LLAAKISFIPPSDVINLFALAHPMPGIKDSAIWYLSLSESVMDGDFETFQLAVPSVGVAAF